MEQINLRTQVAICHTRFAFEHKPKATTLPGTDSQTLPTPCKPDSQPRVKDLQLWQVSPVQIYNPTLPSALAIPVSLAEDPGQTEMHS